MPLKAKKILKKRKISEFAEGAFPSDLDKIVDPKVRKMLLKRRGGK